MANENVLSMLSGIVLICGILAVIGVPWAYSYYHSVVVDKECMVEIATTFCVNNNFSYSNVWDGESFYCRAQVDLRVDPNGKRLVYYFIPEEIEQCKVKEANTWSSIKT